MAYALAGSMDVDITQEPLGTGSDGEPVFLRDIWPSPQDVAAVVGEAITSDMYASSYADVFAGTDRWQAIEVPAGETFSWDPESTYVRKPPYFDGMQREPEPLTDITGAKVLAKLGDSVTTDHISPAGSIRGDSPGRQVPAGARREAQGLQQLRLPPRQPRGHDPRDVRQHPPAQPARARHRGRLHGEGRLADARSTRRRRPTRPRARRW